MLLRWRSLQSRRLSSGFRVPRQRAARGVGWVAARVATNAAFDVSSLSQVRNAGTWKSELEMRRQWLRGVLGCDCMGDELLQAL